jgi:hypothetical protein
LNSRWAYGFYGVGLSALILLVFLPLVPHTVEVECNVYCGDMSSINNNPFFVSYNYLNSISYQFLPGFGSQYDYTLQFYSLHIGGFTWGFSDLFVGGVITE